MAGAARRTVVLADSSKHHGIAPYLVLPTSGIDLLVTEDEGSVARWRARDVEVLLAGPGGRGAGPPRPDRGDG